MTNTLGVARVRAAGVAVALAIVTGAMLASATVARGDNDGYAFTNVRVENLDASHARVVYDYGWASNEFPGWRTCTWTVYDATGNAVGSTTNDLMGLNETYTAKEKIVSVSAPGTTADVDCEPGALGSSDEYTLDEVRAVRRGNDPRMVTVLFNTAWRGSGRPGAVSCTAVVKDRGGSVLTTQQFDFATAASHQSDASHSWLADQPLPERPMTADLDCSPYGT